MKNTPNLLVILALLGTGCVIRGTHSVPSNQEKHATPLSGQLMGLQKPFGMVRDPLSSQWARPEVLSAFWALRKEGEKVGWRVTIISGYRSFENQTDIWNRRYISYTGRSKAPEAEKVFGPFLPGPLPWETHPPFPDESGCVEPTPLPVLQAAERREPGPAWVSHQVMRYISVPGFSRHHWGTDLDFGEEILQSRARLPSGPQAERMHAFYDWLDRTAPKFGFCRAYQGGAGAIHDEPWHWTYLKSAKDFERRFRSLDDFSALDGRRVEGWFYLKRRLPEMMKLMVDSVRLECSSLDEPPLDNEYGESDH